MRRFIEYQVTFLKELQIAKNCKNVRESLLNYLTKDPRFSEELSSYFIENQTEYSDVVSASEPSQAAPLKKIINKLSSYATANKTKSTYAVLTTDPSQVALLKKIINALDSTEKGLQGLESVNIGKEQYTLGIAKDFCKASWNTIHELYAALQLINHSSIEVQTFIGSHFNTLLPKMALVAQSLQQFTPENMKQINPEQIGTTLAATVKQLPSEKSTGIEGLANLSQLIFSLPHYFEELQKWITTEHSGIASKSTDNAQEYQAAMFKKAKKTQRYLEKLTTKKGLFLFPSYFATIKKLLVHSSELLTTAAPLTKQAYLNASTKLNRIRHSLLPSLISEIENVEESMGLKSGVLTDPVVKQMNNYYTQLATQVNNIAVAAENLDSAGFHMNAWYGKLARKLIGDKKAALEMEKPLTPITNLTVMCDEDFVHTLRENQIKRLQANLVSLDTSKLEAANRFFTKLADYTPVFQTTHKWSLANISQAEKESFLAEYKYFQENFASLYPDIDKLLIDTLTSKNDDSSLLARITHSAYKQLWSANHFKQVMACQNAVISNIKQSLSQSEFNIKLIKKTILHSEENIYQIKNEKTDLNEAVQPFSPLEYSFEEGRSAGYYYQKKLDSSIQHYHLNVAKENAANFFNNLRNNDYNSKQKIGELSDLDKEKLRKYYKKFQPVVLAKEEKEKKDIYNKILVDALADEQNTSSLTGGDLLTTNEKLTMDHIDELLLNTQQDINIYIKQETDPRDKELNANPMKALGAEFQQRTLFGQLSNLKLSTAINEFTQSKVKSFLEENLDPSVFHYLSFNEKDLPFLQLYKDSPDVVMYKKLLNSLYYIKTSLVQLEKLNDDNANYLPHRSLFLYKTAKPLLDLNNARLYLTELAQNPQLRAIVNDGLAILAPLQNIPALGGYLGTPSPLTEIEEKIDIIAAWKAEQKNIKKYRSSLSEKAVTDEEKIVSPVVDKAQPKKSVQAEDLTADVEYYLREIALQLYQIPEIIQKINPKTVKLNEGEAQESQEHIQEKAELFIKELQEISSSTWLLNPSSLKKILLTCNKLNTQLSEIGKESRDLIMGNLKVIRTSLETELIAISHNAEFHLGLKPGVLSATINQKFDDFYKALVINPPFKQDQESLQLLIDTTKTENFILKEKERLAKVEANQEYIALKKQILVNDNAQLHSLYKQMDKMIAATPEEGGQLLTKEYLISIYQELYPVLVKFKENEQYSIDSFEKIDNESFVARLEEIQKIIFLHYYQELQPYLFQIDNQYDTSFFLKTLQTTNDFKSALFDIINLKDKLHDFVESKKKIQQHQIKLCNHRIDYFEEQLQQEKLTANARIEDFKNKVFYNYIHTNVRSKLDTELSLHSDKLFNKITAYFDYQKTKLLENITIDDNIESSISKKIEPSINETIDALKKIYGALHTVNTWIEQLKKGNPTRTEKLALLEEYKQSLTIDNILDIPEAVNQIEIYNRIIEIYDTLSKIKAHDTRHQYVDSPSKINQLKQLQNELINKDKTPAERLETVKTLGTSEECQKILQPKPTDKSPLKSLRLSLTGRKSKRFGLFHSFEKSISKDSEKITYDRKNSP